jgi:hypothetical protein
MAGDVRRTKIRRLMAAVGEVLLRDWDPLGVADISSCRDEYDRYAATVSRYLWEGADEYKVVSYLSQVQEVDMRLSHADAERDRLVAHSLLALTI